MSDTATVATAIISIAAIVLGAFLLSRRFTSKISSMNPDSPDSFARLVVAEMALFHRSTLDRARSQMAIYRLLKSDIDRTRQMFLARFPDSEQTLYAALVAILAQGRAGCLGTDYPYSTQHAPDNERTSNRPGP